MIFFRKLEKLGRTRGLPFVVKYVKESRNAVMRHLSGTPLSSGVLVSLDKDGWPVWLTPLKEWAKGPEHLKVINTLLVCLRWVKLTPVLNTDTITAPSKARDLTSLEIAKALYLLRIEPIKFAWESFHISVKSGPVGQALLMSMTEATLLPQWLIDNLILLGGSKLASRLEDLRENFDILPDSASHVWSKIFPPRSSSLRKLSYFSDKEGKTRVIAILDYWSQSALKPLHDSLNEILKRIKSDCTFNQGKFLTLLADKPIYYSIDLTAATDRMPLSLQKAVLTFIIGEQKAQAWADTLVKLGFNTKSIQGLVYAAGQPMGAYSSWPTMALTHHILVQVAFLRTIPTDIWPKLRSSFKNYALLGDDLVIADHKVADSYFQLLKQLDMDYSPEKTHVSKTTYEFAKRWVHNGVEITGYPVGAVNKMWKSYSLLSNLITNQENHGYVLSPEQLRIFIHALHKLFRPKSYAFEHTNRFVNLYSVFSQLSKDKMTGNFSATFLCIRELFGHSLPSSHLYDDQDYLYKVVLFAKKRLTEMDLQKVSRSHFEVLGRLNKIVAQYVEAWPDQDQNTLNFLWETVPAMLTYSSPLLSSLNDVIENYHKALITNDFSKVESYDLSKYFISKSVFSMKRSESVVLSQSALTKFIINSVKDSRSELFIKELYPNQEGNSIIYL